MGLKAELEKLGNVQIQDLWLLWVQQNQELPHESRMIEELMDAVHADAVAEAELLLTVRGWQSLSEFLLTAYAEYKRDILPLMPKGIYEVDEDYVAFDAVKQEFLESVWDVISQHFSDDDDKHFEFTITLSGDGCCAVDAWIDAIEAFNLDSGAYGNF